MDKRMFDFERFYLGVAHVMPDNPVLAEVGVADGASAVYLAEMMLNLGKKPRLYMIDSLDYGGVDQLNAIISHIQAAKLGDFITLIPEDSLNASCRFPDVHFDFVFIDASHRIEFTKADIRLWWRKVKEGCLLAGHDYNEEEGNEVKQAVDFVFPAGAFEVRSTEREYGIWSAMKLWTTQIN